ncbi:MAG: cytochrome c oxidase subunit 3 [Candidatus Acidiferrales bacterium]
MPSVTYTPRGGGTSGAIRVDRAGAAVVIEPLIRGRATSAAVSKTEPSQTGIWVAICAISMSFAALTSAIVVRQGSAADWQRFVLPHVLYFNTAILLASSFTVELARKRMAAAVQDSESAKRLHANAVYWLYVTLALGLIFVFGQYLAWRDIAAQGMFLATSPSSSFFYLLTALHGLHVLGGVAGLIYAAHRLSRNVASAKTNALAAAAVYWHFMDILWVYLLLIIAIRM